MFSRSFLLILGAVEAIVLAMSFTAWRREARRSNALRLEKIGREADLAAVSKALQNEIMWRLAGENPHDRGIEPANSLKSRPARELQELIAKHNFETSTTAITREDFLGRAVEGDQII
jgi:hypothetical protein